MNPIQQKILHLAKIKDISKIRQVDMVKMVGCKYPSQIDHHKKQLIKNGYLVRNSNGLVAISTKGNDNNIITIPLMGEASCGEATKFADGRIMDNLVISRSFISTSEVDNLYALVAKGDSMNRAVVRGKEIQDGDYLIIEKRDGYIPSENDIVVSLIGNLANIKRFVPDKKNNRVLLVSDSYQKGDFAPIIIDENDDFMVDGKVIDVIKGVY